MASTMSAALRSSSKRLLHPSSAWRTAASRGISSTTRASEAHNFAMPALSPTMTEGTIASWKIKEGDKFSAGDVILEVETDKAQMDVEAQDDGILAKIFVQAGKDPIAVGTRIGILADQDDDISSLEIPAEDKSSASAPAEKSSSSSSSSSSDPPPAPEKKSSPSPPPSESKDSHSDHSKPRKNPFVASPGLTHLLHTNGLELGDVKGTGPGGRVLKGDVLAHLGKIDKEKPTSLAGEIAKLAKLDLSNIKIKKPEPAAAKKEAPKKAEEKKVELPKELEIAVEVSLEEVFSVQKRLKEAANVNVHVSSFIARAVAEANVDLPPSKIPPTSSQLFDQILGSPSSSSSQPLYIPQLTTEAAPAPPKAVKAVDVFDILTGKSSGRAKAASLAPVPRGTVNMLRLKVAREDEQRALAFLARLKVSLEEAPEDLI